MTEAPKIIVIGGGGHAKVLLNLLRLGEWQVLGFTEVGPGRAPLLGIPCLGTDEVVAQWEPRTVRLVNGVGSIGSSGTRLQVFERFKSRGYTFASVIHPSAVVSSDACLGEGVQIMAGAVVQPGCRFGENVVINTRASIDHDCELDAHAQVGPGAVLAGGVRVAKRAYIGAGATVIQYVSIGAAAIVGAGAVVTRDIPPTVTVVGVPAKILEAKRELNPTTGPKHNA